MATSVTTFNQNHSTTQDHANQLNVFVLYKILFVIGLIISVQNSFNSEKNLLAWIWVLQH